MAFDERATHAFRGALAGEEGVTEKRMMGAICFFANGNMIGGADRPKGGVARLMFRVGKDNEERVASWPGAEPMVMGARRMKGFFFVEAETCKPAMLKKWIALALAHARSLPPK